MRWTGSAVRLFELGVAVLMAVTFVAPAGGTVDTASRLQGDDTVGEYEVQPGDTLWAIARSQLGDPHRWPEIAAASEQIAQPHGERLVDPDLIRPGWTLALPPPEPVPAPPPAAVPGIIGSTQVTAGEGHSCALVAGRIKCWGGLSYGATPVAVTGIEGATAVSGGYNHSCAIVAGGHVKCWGNNDYGQLGDGTNNPSATPVTVTELVGATSVSAGSLHSCAIVAGGQVKCWGQNRMGELGDGTTIASATPVTVPEVTATTVVAADSLTCAVVTGGTVKCWGNNDYGVLGDGTWDTAPTGMPVSVHRVTDATAVVAGYTFVCTLLASGQVTCWGNNESGQLGDRGTYPEESHGPVAVAGVAGATAIAAGYNHACAVVAGGKVKCWGGNYEGQLGDGTTKDSSKAKEVPGVTGATSLAASNHTCAIMADGQLTCWGTNDLGKLGIGSSDRP